jgi:N-acetyl-anhydromuramyl-L-alanine amidase AmpD
MDYRRRSFLKLSGAAIAGTSALGATAQETAAAPAVEWNPAAASNYRNANRTTADIDWIILHTIQGSHDVGVNTFKDPSMNVSAHYIVGREPGQFTQMVRNRDIAWTAGNSGYNARGINIEMAGYAGTGFSDQMYKNMAELVRFLCENYDIPKRGPQSEIAACNAANGAGGIIGHVHIPGEHNCNVRGGSGGHTDPGPYFDYDRLIEAISEDRTAEFEVGQEITATRALNARAAPEIGFNVIHTHPKGTRGTLIEGIEIADGYVWWNVEWDNGITGWAIQQYMTEAEEEDDGGRGPGEDERDDDSGENDPGEDDSDGSGTTFKIGERVDSTVNLNTRSQPSLDGRVRETVDPDTVGWIQDGIVTADGYTWWQVEWETGTTGWSVQRYLDESSRSGSDRTGGVDSQFEIGSEISSTVYLNTRSQPTLNGRIRDTVAPGTDGQIRDGLVTADGYIWWQVEWETGTTGWSVETYLEKSDGLALLFGW